MNILPLLLLCDVDVFVGSVVELDCCICSKKLDEQHWHETINHCKLTFV